MPPVRPRDHARAQRDFDRGMRHLGYRVDSRTAISNRELANAAFRSATEVSPGMADAWLARYATGETQIGLLNEVLRTSASLHHERGRLGLDADCFGVRFDLDLFAISVSMANLGEVAGRYAVELMESAQWAEAHRLLTDVRTSLLRGPMHPHDQRGLHVASLIHAILHLRTWRYPDVISVLVGSERWTDSWLLGAANYAVGTACAQLGLYAEAERRLELAQSGPNVDLVPMVITYRALIRRAQGDEVAARSMLEQSYARDPTVDVAREALLDPSYELIQMTAEQIATRTDPFDPQTEVTAKQEGAVRAADLLAAASAELDAQIGLPAVKDQIKRLRASVELGRLRGESSGAGSRSRHLIFTGPPGTGKTTIARIVAKIYCGLELLATDTVVEASRGDLVGQHLGETAQKTHALVDSALDGVLFIDEAYNLVEDGIHGGDAFGNEAVAALLARMENDRHRLVVIIAGYAGDIDRFLASNEGLASRFRTRIQFSSYPAAELGDIAAAMAQRRGAPLTAAARAALVAAAHDLESQQVVDRHGIARPALDVMGNARFVRNVVETAEEERDYRIVHGSVPPASLAPEVRDRIEAEDVHLAVQQISRNG